MRQMEEKLRSFLRTYGVRRPLVASAQLLVFAISGVAAFLLRFD